MNSYDVELITNTPKRQTKPVMDYYKQAFFLNHGVINYREQQWLRKTCVSILGMDGMGGSIAVALARTGIGKFHLADFEEYKIDNTNHQYGAAVNTMGRNKAEVIAENIALINPEAKITYFTEPITDFNIDQFLEGTKLVIDCQSLFNPDCRSLLYRKARKNDLYVVMATSLGFSATLHIFSPKGMTFDKYFNLKNTMSHDDKILSFLAGVAPKGLHKSYHNNAMIDLVRKRTPVVGAACLTGSGMAVTEAINILLNKKPVRVAPFYAQFDPYAMKYRKGYLWLGNSNPVQKLKIMYAKYFGMT